MSFGPNVQPPAVAPPPPPPPNPASPPVQVAGQRVQKQAKQASGKGFGGTLLTSPQGAPAPSVAKDTLGAG